MFERTDIEKYFDAEKQAGLLFIVIGVVAVLLALGFFFFLRSGFYKGAAIPLLIFGLIELFAGRTVYKRSDEDRVRNVYAYSMDPQSLKDKELPRIKQVNRNFVVYRWIEIVLIIAGLLLLLIFKGQPARSFWFGLGITLTIQVLLLFVADHYAARRALEYAKQLSAYLTKKQF